MSGVGSLAATAVEPQSMGGNDSFYAGKSSGFKLNLNFDLNRTYAH